MTTFDKSLFQSVMNMMDHLVASENYDALTNLLSLLCLFSILNRNQLQQSSSAPATMQNTGNPLQKLLGDLTKGGDGGGLGGLGSLGGLLGGALGSPDMLSSLLPLLNNPQLKSKLNPGNISSIMGVINNLSNLNNHEKPEPVKPKNEKPATKASDHTPAPAPMPASTPAKDKPQEFEPLEQKLASPVETLVQESISPDSERKSNNRFLNWKTNF